MHTKELTLVTIKYQGELRLWCIAIILNLLFIGCGPQHHYSFQQIKIPDQGVILSMQGYVLDSSEINTLKKDWNALVREMEKRPGFISAYLSTGVGDSKLTLAHSTWKDLESLRQALFEEDIMELEAKLPKQQFQHIFSLGTLGMYPEK